MDRDRTTNRSGAEYFILAFGIAYLAVGLLGFTVTGNVGFADTQGDQLFGLFEVNPLHNIVHLVIGAVLVLGFLAGARATAAAAGIIAATYLVVAIAGPFMTGTESNVLALNTADHWLHAASAVALGIAAIAVPTARRTYRAGRMEDEHRPRRAA